MRWWPSGIRSAVGLAAWLAATRATERTSPFVVPPRATSEAVSDCMCTLARATARRWLGSLGVTSTIRALPSGSRGGRPRPDMVVKPTPGGRRGSVAAPSGCSAADLAHRPPGTHELHLVDGVAGPLRAHAGFDGGREVVVGAAASQHAAQVVVLE